MFHSFLRPLLSAALAIAAVPALADTVPAEIKGAVNLLGFDAATPNSSGSLVFRHDDLVFAGSKSSGAIPFAAIRRLSIEHSNKGLLRGTKGTVASFAPQGVGQMYSLFRPGAETLTILYVDQTQGLHGAVVLLPKSSRDETLEAFARAGLQPDTPSPRDPAATRPGTRGPIPHDTPSLKVAFPASHAPGLPQAYVAAIYETLITRLTEQKTAGHIWRDGDVRANHNAHNLLVTITHAKKGNAGVRGAIPVAGMIAGKTLIEADVQLTDAFGATLLDGSFKGSKRTPGESIAATQSLAQRVAKAVGKVDANPSPGPRRT